MCVPQFPSSVTPACSPPSHLWTALDSLSSVLQGSSVCPAKLWVGKVRARSIGSKQRLKMFVQNMYIYCINMCIYIWALVGFQGTSVSCCMRRAVSCPSFVESLVKNTPWESTSPSPMIAAKLICATKPGHRLPTTGPARYSHFSCRTPLGE